jgi:hypothetical protein
MGKLANDGLARLQNESRIPATTWRQWCNLLEMHPDDAIGVWEEVCHPIMIAKRKVPEVPYIMQLRCGRPELDIYEFKDECAKVLYFISFLFNLDDDRLTKGKIKSALLKLYKGTSARVSDGGRQNELIERYMADACALVVIAKVVKGDSITLTGVLKPVVDGKASIAQVASLALKSLGDAEYAAAVRQFLHDPFVNPSAPPLPASEIVGSDDDDDDDDSPIDAALLKFKNALHAIYEAEAGTVLASVGSGEDDDGGMAADEDDLDGDTDQVLDGRLKVTAVFDPMRAAIPSMEEAQNIARRLEAARNAGKNRPTLAARASAPPAAGGGASAGGGAGGATVIKGGDAAAVAGSAAEGAAAAENTPGPRKDGKKSARVDMAKAADIEIEPTDFVDVADVSFPEFSERVKQVCGQLATVEKLDLIVWSLFIDPAAPVGDVKALARMLDKENTDTFKAYSAIRMAAQYLQLKNLLSATDKVLKKERNFMLEVTGLLNAVNNSTRALQPEARPLAPLAKVLDHAAAALVRLEAVRVNTKMGDDHGEQYSREATTVYFEGALRQVTDLTDRELLNQAREQADVDTVSMLGAFGASKLIQHIHEGTQEYARGLVDAGHADSVPSLEAHFSEQPLSFDDVEASESAVLPAELLKPSELGDIFDTVVKYVCTSAWAVMEAAHAPETVTTEIIENLRQVLVSCIRFQPERRRHQDNPRLALTVVGLDKVSGNANLNELYVGVSEGGELHYVEGFEDGAWVDLFQLREFKPAQMAAAAKKKADESDTKILQTGRKYLFSVGRAKRLFGESAAEVINGCFRGDNGETKVFPAF